MIISLSTTSFLTRRCLKKEAREREFKAKRSKEEDEDVANHIRRSRELDEEWNSPDD
jgi:hypothetical protein